MAINIPNVGSFGEAAFGPSVSPHTMINYLFNRRHQEQLTPFQIQLMQAQAAEASGKAAESNMMNEFAQRVLGINTNNYNNSGNQQIQFDQYGRPTQDNKYNPMINQSSQPEQRPNKNNNAYSSTEGLDKLKEFLEMRGKIVPTAKEKAKLDIETNFQKTLSEHDAKKIGELEDIEANWIQSEPSYQEAAAIVSDPEWKNMRDSTMFPNAQLEFYKKTGNEKQIKLLTDMESKTNQFIMNSIHKFPQRFTNSDLSYMKSLKINDKDSIYAAQAKLAAAYKYDKILSERAGIAAQIAREKRVPINQALKMANKLIDIDAIRKDIDEQVKTKTEKNSEKTENNRSNKLRPEDITAENIMNTAKKRGISVPEVIRELEKRGYTIPEGPMR